MITATEYKKKWRNRDRDIKDIAGNPDHDFIESEQYKKRTVYLIEMEML